MVNTYGDRCRPPTDDVFRHGGQTVRASVVLAMTYLELKVGQCGALQEEGLPCSQCSVRVYDNIIQGKEAYGSRCIFLLCLDSQVNPERLTSQQMPVPRVPASPLA